jgi:acyl-coenzyme A thioesterase PaaI-like protein
LLRNDLITCLVHTASHCGCVCGLHLAGVSVSLTGELFDDISAGQTVVLRAAVSKVGANLGFTEMRVINTSGELLARVKHIKYLNMGSM